LRVSSRQFDLAQQSPGHYAVVSFDDEGAGNLVGGLHIALGQVNAGQERAGGEGGLKLQALLHHLQRIVGPVLGQESPRPQVEQRDEGRIAGDEYVQAGVHFFDMIPAQEEVEQAAALIACQLRSLSRSDPQISQYICH